MQAHKNVEEVNEEDQETSNHPISLTEYSQTHPYQYLKQLNNVFQACNKSSGKDYSTASKIKLPWKKFKTVSIPKCFEESYNLERNETCILKNQEDKEKSEQVQKQKKFWKEHQQLMKRYRYSHTVSQNMKKQQMEERKRNLFSAKSCISSKNKNQFSMTKTIRTKLQHSMRLSCAKENNVERFQTLKTQSDHTQTSALCQSKELIAFSDKDKHQPSSNLLRDTTNTHSFLNKRGKRLKCFNEEMTVEEQVLMKLKKISMMPHLNRAKTANILSRQGKGFRDRQKLEGSFKKTYEIETERESRVKENEYLEYNLKEELISRYKSKIKEIDCSISQKNVKKTAAILREMQQLANVNIEDY